MNDKGTSVSTSASPILQCYRRLLHSIAIIVSAVVMATPAETMEFRQTYINPFDKSVDLHPYFLMQGQIVPGDYDRLIRYAKDNNLDLTTFRVILSSPGGDVTEALRLGKFLKSIYAPVSVGPEYGQCASACFIIFASAVERASMSGLIGIHRPYLSPERMRTLSPGQAEASESRAMLNAEEYLHQLRVPNNLVEVMFEHASNEIHWLSDDELERQLGKRPPWYEEFLIARCGLDKAVEQRFLAEPENHVLYDQIMSVFACGFDLTRADAQRAFTAAITDDHKALFASLHQEVPGWEGINTSSAFLAWLDQPDVFTGSTRRKLLKDAFEKNDATRVVAIFKEYMETNTRRNRSPGSSTKTTNLSPEKISATN